MEAGGEEDLYRYECVKSVGVITSASCNTVYAAKGKHVISGVLEDVVLRNFRTDEVIISWSDRENIKSSACHICPSPTDPNIVAVGYEDGSIRVWKMNESVPSLVFNGHRNAITCLSFDPKGMRLASAARDNDIVLWDLVAECGIYRLSGHTNSVTGLIFSPEGDCLISVARDSLMKVWDLASQHCVETSVQHHQEITAAQFILSNMIATVGADNKVRIFRVNFDIVGLKMGINKRMQDGEEGREKEENVLTLVETLNRSSNERAVYLVSNKKYLLVLGNDRSLEIWSISNQPSKKSSNNQSIFKHVRYAKMESKARSVEFTPGWSVNENGALKVLISFTDNRIAEVKIPLDNSIDLEVTASLDRMGHRTDPRIVTFSKDGSLFATAAKQGGVIVWNSTSLHLVRSINSIDDPTAILFIPDGKGLIIGDGVGGVHLVDLIGGEVVDSVKGHEGGPIRSITLSPDNRGLLTCGGNDKLVKFWEFKTSKNNELGLKVKLIKTLQLNDEVLMAKYSPDRRFIAVATLDMTIKVFFEDSLKFYLSLYGHKLPITAFDISEDGKVLISASADKNVKIWSLEFGECRKSIHAHQEAITSLQLIPRSKNNNFITAGKDKMVKIWDGGSFEEVQKLSGHQGEVWQVAASMEATGATGPVIVSVSKDRSIRVWRQSLEMIFPEEEKELELEAQLDQSMLEDNPFEQDREKNEEVVGRASVKTLTSMKAGERIVECIEAADDERRKWDEYEMERLAGHAMEEPTPGAFFLALGKGRSPSDFVLMAFERIPLPDIEEALLCLPSRALSSLLFYIDQWFSGHRNVILSSRILDITLKLFHQVILANSTLRPLIESISQKQKDTLRTIKTTMCQNAAVLKIMSKVTSAK